jgi:trimeric autotransporter adhesin
MTMKNLLSCLLILISNYLFAAPGNDDCSNAVAFTPVTSCGSSATQTLFQATATGSPTSTFGTTYDVWYKFTVPAGINTLTIGVSNLGSNLNSGNTFIEAFNASTCGTISTTNSLGTASSGSGLSVYYVTPGNTYYFRVFTTTNPTSGVTGNWSFKYCVSYSASAPANNDCPGAVTLTTGTTNTSGTVSNATASSGIPVNCATGTPDDDVWYKFVAVRTYATVSVSASSILNSSGAMLQVFSGSCASLVTIGCGKDAVNLTSLTVGQTYYIRVYSFGANGTDAIAGSSNSNAFNISVNPALGTTVGSGRMNEKYQETILSSDNIISDPWEITYGPDNYLWITEAKGYRVFRMDPVTGARTTVLDISRGSTFLLPGDTSFDMRYDITVNNPQGGLAGLALHPKFMAATSPQNYVYLSYVYSFTSNNDPNGIFYVNRVVQFTYNTGTGKLESPVSLCDSIPGSSDHNSQRMIIAPVAGTNYLFYAAGDMGAGQFGNQWRTNKAQNSASYEGKILRFNLVPDGDADAYQKWIPNDNPISQSAVWSLGIRNNQGFAYDTTNGLLYGASHGPYTDDEINIIEKNKNYGHPLVIGFAADGNYNNSSAGSPNTTSACPLITNEATAAAAITNYKDPLFSAYAENQAYVHNVWVTNPSNGGWHSEAWSGIDIYKHTIVPGWKNSLVACSLKWGRLVRLKLGAAGTTILPTNGTDTVSYFGGQNRFRDLAFDPNGKDVYVVMDRSTTSSGPSSANPVVPNCAGCIQKFTFIGYADASGKSSIPDAIDVTAGTGNAVTQGTTIKIDDTNNMMWVPITGPDGNILAEIYANGQNLDTVTSAFYINSGAIRVKGGVHYLDRNMTITPKNQPAVGSPVKIRLYFSKAEYDALDADAVSGVTAITDLKILKNDDPISSSVQTTTTLIPPTYEEAHGTAGYMLEGDISHFSSFYFATSNITLPLQLLTFTGSLQNDNTALLKWETANEINTSFFVVERSLDGSHFNAIGNVAAYGNNNTNSIFDYSFTDREAADQPSSVLFYRLKSVDQDGAYKYSNIITITLADITGNVSVSPNPAVNETKASISVPADGRIQWKLSDNIGRVFLQGTQLVKKGSGNSFPINLNKLASGTYYLTVKGAGIDQKVKIQKL